MGENRLRTAGSKVVAENGSLLDVNRIELDPLGVITIDVFVSPGGDPATLAQRMLQLDLRRMPRAARRRLSDDPAVADDFEMVVGELRLGAGADFHDLGPPGIQLEPGARLLTVHGHG